MNTRDFLAAAAAAPAAEAAQNAGARNTREQPPTKFLMKLGMQDHMSDDDLAYYSSVGVEQVCTSCPPSAWTKIGPWKD